MLEVTIGHIKMEYIVVTTGAPRDYDGFGTVELVTVPHTEKVERWVLIRPKHLAWQQARYGSGNFGSVVRDEPRWDKVAEDYLVKKVTAAPNVQ